MKSLSIALLFLSTLAHAKETAFCSTGLFSPADQGIVQKISNAYQNVVDMLIKENELSKDEAAAILKSKNWFGLEAATSARVNAARGFKMIEGLYLNLAPEDRVLLDTSFGETYEKIAGQAEVAETKIKIAKTETDKELKFDDAVSRLNDENNLVSRDGRYATYQKEKRSRERYAIDLIEKKIITLPKTGFDDRTEMVLSPDSKLIAVGVNKNDSFEVQVIELATGNLTASMVVKNFDAFPASHVLMHFDSGSEKLHITHSLREPSGRGGRGGRRGMKLIKRESKVLDLKTGKSSKAEYVFGEVRAPQIKQAAFTSDSIFMHEGLGVNKISLDGPKQKVIFKGVFANSVRSIDATPDGKFVYVTLTTNVGSQEGTPIFTKFNAESGKKLWQISNLEGKEPKSATSARTAFTPDMTRVAIYEELATIGEPMIEIYDPEKEELIMKIASDLQIRSAHLSNDGNMIAVHGVHWSKQPKILIYDITGKKPKLLKTLKNTDAPGWFSEDGNSYYIMSEGGLVATPLR